MRTTLSSEMSSTPGTTHVQKKLRKGTHSCFECRRRKIRCIFRAEDPNVCTECFARGSRCRGQQHVEASPQVVDNRPNLRERVAKLEQLLEALQPGADRKSIDRSVDRSSTDTVGETERGAAEALSNLRSDGLTLLPMSSDAQFEYSSNAPLLSVFDHESSNLNSRPQRPALDDKFTRETPLEIGGTMGSAMSKNMKIRQTLLAQLPPSSELDKILESSNAWWKSWRPLGPLELETEKQQSLQQFVKWGITQENPTIMGIALLCVGISVQQLPPGTLVKLSLPPHELMYHYMNCVERLIISEDEYAGSLEGIQAMVLQAKCFSNLSQPRKSWLLFRRAMLHAQLMGINRNRPMFARETPSSIIRRKKLWYSLCEVDCYNSLTLGLPHAVSGEDHEITIQEFGKDWLTPTEIYRRKLCVIAGQVIDRDQLSSSPALPHTLAIDQRLEDLVRSMPSEWWDMEQERASSAPDYYERLAAHFWTHQIKAFLHLPFMLQSGQDGKLEYSRLACFEGSRAMLRTYHAMRLNSTRAFNMVKIIDFQGFTAAVFLMLGLLRYGRNRATPDTFQEAQDCQLIDITMAILRQAASEPGGTVAAQALQGLETLSSARQHMNYKDKGKHSNWDGKVVVPYFGVITLLPGTMFASSTACPSSGLTAGGPLTPSSDVTGSSTMRSPQPILETTFDNPQNLQVPDVGGFDPVTAGELPQIDVDWTGMINMDLDQDWSWYLEEAGL